MTSTIVHDDSTDDDRDDLGGIDWIAIECPGCGHEGGWDDFDVSGMGRDNRNDCVLVCNQHGCGETFIFGKPRRKRK